MVRSLGLERAALRRAWPARARFALLPRSVWAIVVIAFALRLPGLTESLWYDELWATHVALGSLDLLRGTVEDDIHPPLYALAMYLWIRVVGDSEIAVRLPPLVLGVASIPLLHRLGSRVANQRVALVACLLLALSPTHVWYSQEARPYTVLAFGCLLATLAYVELDREKPARAWCWAYLLSTAALTLSHYYLAVYPLLFGVLALWTRHQARSWVLASGLLGLAALTALTVVRYLAWSLMPHPADYLRPFSPSEWWSLLFNWFLLGNAVWPPGARLSLDRLAEQPLQLLVQLAAAALFGYGLWRILRGSRHGLLLLGSLVALPALLLILPLIGFTFSYVERSALVLLPCFLLVLAQGTLDLRPPALGAIALSGVLGVSLVAYGFMLARDDEWTVYKQNPDWRAAAHWLWERHDDDSQPLLLLATTWATEVVYYHPEFLEVRNPRRRDLLPRERLPGGAARPLVVNLDLSGRPCAFARRNGFEEFYLVRNRYWSWAFAEVMDAALSDDRCLQVDATSFKGLDLYHFQVVAPPPLAAAS